MFKKLVAIEPVSLVPWGEEKLYHYAETVVLYEDVPADAAEIIKRIGDADGVLVNYTSTIGRDILDACPNIRYIGMCCSLYSPESANVDILAADEKNITVSGIRDYGDPGVVEYVISELARYLHGFGAKQWKTQPVEITGLRVGIVGLGTTGQMIAEALMVLGADIGYYSRTRKPEQEARGIQYLPLRELLAESEVVFGCLNKNVVLFHEEEFQALGNHKIMFNTSIGPSHDLAALKQWLDHGSNEFFCDTAGALGDPNGDLLNHVHVNCMGVSSGRTQQAFERLSAKVLDNIRVFLEEE